MRRREFITLLGGAAAFRMTAISKEREQRRHWQQVRKMILEEEANMAAVSWQLRLAVLKTLSLT